MRIGAEVEHFHAGGDPRLRACAGVVDKNAVLDVNVHRFCGMQHQGRIGLPALDIVATVQTLREMVQHCGFTERVLHFAHRAVGDHAHRHVDRVQQRLCARNDFQFSIKQARDFIAVHRLKGRLVQINAVLRVNGVDNLVQLNAFEALKNLV